ncbi:MAG TPA: CoA transferase [Candidatus Polarisedimenticolaceae bacterium]|nr:CoA transferase [Candidatus Polarisedimenticolaceae bacterium]
MRALEGIEVVSLAVNVPGPVAASRLAAEGARITKVEPPEGDPLSLHVPPWYARLTESQTVVRLDLKRMEGKRALASLLGGADLLLTSNRPRTLERLHLDFPALHARYPRLCQLQIIGFPPPDDDLPGHDLSFQAAAGLVVDPPRMPFTLLADLAGAERAVAEAMAMLLCRERTGEATCRQVALADAAASLATPIELGMCGSQSPLGGAHPGYALYATEDGWVALAALEPRFMRMLEEALGLAPTADRLRDVFRTRPTSDWEAWGRQHGVPVTRVR